jgi:hypothetical protein
MDEFKTYATITEKLKQQVLSAVDPIYYHDLEDDTFGYADVCIPAIITHLTTTYGTLTASDLEINRDKLTEAWNPDDPIENLWKNIKIVRAIATQGGEPISNGTTSHYAMHGTAVNPNTGGITEHKELSTCSDGNLWQASNADESGHMFQGLGPDSYMPTGTNTLFFIDKKNIPKNKKLTYVRVVCANRPEKTNPKRVRWTAGGDKVKYTGNVTTQTADIKTAKCLFSSVVSTPNGRFMTLDLKDFYLCSDLPDYEYVRIPTHMLPSAIVELYQLESKIYNGYVYAEVRMGMYGLPQAGKLAND